MYTHTVVTDTIFFSSFNSWCNTEPCVSDKLVPDSHSTPSFHPPNPNPDTLYYHKVVKIQERIAEVSEVPYDNHEFLQMLRYEPGQYYVPHHDFIPGHVNMPCGPRIMTFFLYLSDVVEGGETAFPLLRDKSGGTLKVTPKQGAALIWPNVNDQNSLVQDYRTKHEAVPVTKGVKFAANAWIHLHNFRDPNKFGCTG